MRPIALRDADARDYAERQEFEMLLAIAQHGNFLTTWVTLSVLTFVLMMLMSGTLFRRYYDRPTFETWQRKSNPSYPPPAMVRREVLQMLKGVYTAALCP